MTKEVEDVVKVLNPTSLEIGELIRLIRESFIGSEMTYTMGSCYKLYTILKYVFPKAEAWCYKKRTHVLVKYDGCFYDITGEVEVDESVLFKLRDEAEGVLQWKFNLHDVHVDCPNCGEYFLRHELTHEYERTQKRYNTCKGES